MPRLAKTLRSSRGQSIIEAIVAIAIAVIIIGALVNLGISGSRRATLARQATQATIVARERVEIIRNARDSNQPFIKKFHSNSAIQYLCPDIKTFDFFFTGGTDSLGIPWNGDLDDQGSGFDKGDYGEGFHMHPSTTYLPSLPHGCTELAGLWHIDQGEYCYPGDGTEVVIDEIHFCVEQFLADTPVSSGGDSQCNNNLDYRHIKQLTVVVYWDSPVGRQFRINTTCLARQT